MSLAKENYRLLQHLKGKTIRWHDPIYGWTPPVFIKSMGMKRVHIDVYDVGSFYITFKKFVSNLWMEYDIIDDVKMAKYVLTGREKSLLDV